MCGYRFEFVFPRREVSVKPIQMASRIWDQVLVSSALYILQSDIAKYSSLIWVEDDVLAFGIICHQSIAHKKRRNATAEANFKRNLRFHRLNYFGDQSAALFAHVVVERKAIVPAPDNLRV
jgi:hypothetical protein